MVERGSTTLGTRVDVLVALSHKVVERFIVSVGGLELEAVTGGIMEVDMLVELARPHAFNFTIVLGLEGGGWRRRRGGVRRHDSGGARTGDSVRPIARLQLDMSDKLRSRTS